jgi:hypothetical protein
VINLACKLPINSNIERFVNLFFEELFDKDNNTRFSLSPSLFFSFSVRVDKLTGTSFNAKERSFRVNPS